jgi:ABC-2 type transport system ATP-binding protein
MENHMSTSAISVTGLSRTQGTFRLDSIDFDLPTGLVMGVVGPNGAGKTTTIKSILGMLAPDSGSVTLFDAEAPGSPSANERIGVVLDQPFVSPDWKVAGVGRRLAKFYSAWDAAAFAALLARFGLDQEARVGTLSRGQGVKLSMAVALAHHPHLLILDEPTSGLDPVSRADLVDVLREFMVDETHSILFSTHITTDLDSLADLILVIDSGRIAYSGTLEALQEEFAMVRGTEDLDARASSRIMGLRRTGSRFEGLIRVGDTALFGPTTVIDTVSTDDVVVHLARRTPERQEHAS